ncbi:MAG: nucleotide sugar dehydrogenase [Euryarchaeota archaeon]|nr:nucleotide sugar dehydrogenase [Euryarchaeota archaeon]
MCVAVYGLGKMGLPLAAVFAERGARVIGVDINPRVVESVNRGLNHIEGEPKLGELVRRNVRAGRLTATTDGEAAAREADVMVILVPVVLDAEKRPDLRALRAVCTSIAGGMEKGDLVLIETTLPPGTTSGVVAPLLESSGLRAGEDFGLAHCPERAMTGRVVEDIMGAYPKIVGGIDRRSTEAAIGIYRVVNSRGVIPVTNATTAEMVKVAEGVYRDVNIAIANELALVARKHGVDVWEVIKAANTQPYCNLHMPGAGVGGHCIPVYPWFIIDEDTRLIRTAREVNDSMSGFLVSRLEDILRREGERLEGSEIAVVGLTYRPGVKETYHSPARLVIEHLKRRGARVYGYDPLLSEEEIRSSMGVEPLNGERVKWAVCLHGNGHELRINAERKIELRQIFA